MKLKIENMVTLLSSITIRVGQGMLSLLAKTD